MAVPQASSGLTFGDVFRLYADVGRFAMRPTLAAKPIGFGEVFIVTLGALFVLDFSLALGALYLETGIAETGHQFPDPVQEEFSFEGDFLSMVILAPILEESLFRGWLRGEMAALRFAAIAWIAVLVSVIGIVIGGGIAGATGTVSLLLVLIGFAQWLGTRKTETQVPDWFKVHYGKLVWVSTLAFGLMHLANYESFGSPVDLMLVASQTIGGLVLAYTRTRLGLAAAIGQHALFNFLILSDLTVWAPA